MELKKSLIENNSILIGAEAKNWKEAIKIATDLLVKSGALEKRYYEKIISNTEEFGPYYIIAPEVAMPHARPEDGVIKNSYSLVTFKSPIYFGEDAEDISILIVLAATSSDNHTEFGIVQVANLFEIEKNIIKIKEAKTKEDILKLII
ncbi:MAG: PTS sugar transporter subunit IIA [Fusobacteriaceae bacterium]